MAPRRTTRPARAASRTRSGRSAPASTKPRARTNGAAPRRAAAAPTRAAAAAKSAAAPRAALPAHADGMCRCAWARPANPLYVAYHDHEWGVPVHDDRRLFEMITLEGAQAGLAWETILNKREGYRRAFEGFDPRTVARYGARDVRRLLADPAIVRNRLKIESAISNARAFLAVQEAFGSFDAYQWGFVDGAPIQNAWRSMRDIPPRTALSDAYSKDLKRRGFRFVGSTIVYAHMQAVGMVNDHLVECFRWAPLRGEVAVGVP